MASNDKIVAVTTYSDSVLVFTDRGKVYRMMIEPRFQDTTVSLLYDFEQNWRDFEEKPVE